MYVQLWSILYMICHFCLVKGVICNLTFLWCRVWKFSNFSHFPATLILREINFGSIQKIKTCIFDNLCSSTLWFFGEFLIFSNVNFSKNHISKPKKLSRWLFLTFSNLERFISRKIRGRKAAKFPYYVMIPVDPDPVLLYKSMLPIVKQ